MTRRGAVALAAMCGGVGLLLLVPGCSSSNDPWAGQTGQVRAVVTIAPLYSLVKAVGGDRVAVKCLCTTTGPHHFQADTRDVAMFKKAHLFFAVGLSLDDTFADQLHAMSRRRDLPFVKLGGRLPISQLLEMQHEHVHADGTKHSHGKYDPHVWLGIPEMIAMAGVVCDELTATDPPGAEEYKKRALAIQDRLRKLDEEGKALLKPKTNKRIVSSHEALGYFARSFGLDIAGTIQPWPGEAPTGKHLEELVKLCSDKAKPVAAITVEPQYKGSGAPRVVQKAIKGVKVPLVEIDPLETADVAELKHEAGDWYEARMRKNLEALAKALP
jgi:ABC-type Zn uptake system ZnuABC Zn-binding protein ZnuA